MPDFIEMTGMCVVLYKGRKLQLTIGVRIGGGRNVPYFEFATETNREVTTRRGEGERCGRSFEGEVVDGDTSGDIGQYGLAIFIDCEEQVALRREPYSRDVLSVGKRECVGLVAEYIVSGKSQSIYAW